MAEGTPLERVQVVNSGARVQIPPSPFTKCIENALKKVSKSLFYRGLLFFCIKKSKAVFNGLNTFEYLAGISESFFQIINFKVL